MKRGHLPERSPQIPFGGQQSMYRYTTPQGNLPQQYQHMTHQYTIPHANEQFPMNCCENFLKWGKCKEYNCHLNHPEQDPSFCMRRKCKYLDTKYGCRKGIHCYYLHPRYERPAAAQCPASSMVYQSSSEAVHGASSSSIRSRHLEESMEAVHKASSSYIMSQPQSSATVSMIPPQPAAIQEAPSSSKRVKIEYIEEGEEKEKEKISYVERKKEILAQLEKEFPGETFNLTKSKKKKT